MKEVKEEYHRNGNLWWRRRYLNGKLYGLSKWLDSYGNLEYRYNYFNDKRHGLSEVWYSNGEQWTKDYKLL